MHLLRRWLVRTESDHGEWCVVDRIRGYRVCAFNEEHHGGTHIHVPETGPIIATIDIPTPWEADAIMRIYAHRSAFDLGSFQEGVRTWRSASSED